MAQQPKLTDDWDKERKKVKVLSVVFVVVMLAVAVMGVIVIMWGNL